MVIPKQIADERASEIVTKAVLRAADLLDLSGSELARILGVSGATVSRLGDRKIKRARKEADLALLFLRLFRSLDALVGGNERAARDWFRSQNHHLNGIPAELVQRPDGLVHVVDYLEAFRGKI